ncbi:MAG: MmgE/PrpD family protein [Caulobacterales bacterium]|jgi:2-methylcitrate dehydratase PrpD
MSGQSPDAWRASALFAAHAATTTLARLQPATRTAIAAFTFDLLGVGVGGLGSPYAARLLSTATRWGEPGGRGASIWGGGSAPLAHAAFCNAFLAHCQEFDAVHEAAVLHPFTVVVPVLLAEAERAGMDGPTYLAACSAGVDVAVTLGVAATSQIRFFRPATCGLFGAIAALGRARGLSEPGLIDAFGYGLAFAAGTMQAHVEGTPALAVQVAHAAQSAFHAVDLAQAGMPGPHGAFDGPFGYINMFEQSHDLEAALADLGLRQRAAEVSWKPFPTGRAAHGGIDMALSLRAQGVSADTLEALTIEAPPLIHHLVGRPLRTPLEVNYARLCLPYAAAVALIRGRVTLADFIGDALADPAIHALASRIDVTRTDHPDPAAFTPQRAQARLRDGQVMDVRVDQLLGSVSRPLSEEAQMEKFAANVAFGFGDSAPDSAPVLALIANLETCADIGALNRWAGGKALG